MGFISMKCPNCSAEIILDDSREFWYCQYCGTKIVQDKIIVEYQGNLQINHSQEAENLVLRAQEFLRQGLLEQAIEYYNRALDLDAKNEKARLGLRQIVIIKTNNALKLAKSLFDVKRYKESEEQYKRVLELDPENVEAKNALLRFDLIVVEPNITINFDASNMCNSSGKFSIVIDDSFKDSLKFYHGCRKYMLPVGLHKIVVKAGDPFSKKVIDLEISNRYTKYVFNIKCRWDSKLTLERIV